MEKPVTCTIAGLGRIGSTLEKDPLREKPASHAGAITANPFTRLIGGADPDKERREEFASDWNVPVFGNTREMLKELQPEILHIAAWTENHPDLLRMGLQEKVPVIVCEKPLADDISALGDLVTLSAESDSRIVMNHERRFSSDYCRVKDIIESREFGNLLRISARLYMGRKRPVEKIIYHDGTHMLDMLRYLSGDDLTILRVSGDAMSEGGALDILAEAGGCSINMEIAGGRDHLVFEFDLSFSEGRIRIGNGIYEEWISGESPYYTGFRSLKKKRSTWKGPTGYFSGMMNQALLLAKNPDAENKSAFRDGFAVMELIRKILSSGQSH